MPTKFSIPSRRAPREVVGLDIEPGYIVAAEASVNGAVVVRRAAGATLDLDVMRDGEVLDVEALTEALRGLFAEKRLGRNVRVGVANQRTVLRTLELPPIADRKELAAAVRFQAQDEVPMPLNNAVLDFQPLGIVETPAGPRQQVALVAAQRDMVDRLLAAVRAAGLRPIGLDLAAFAMIRALYRPGDQGRLVYLGVGGLTNMAVAEGPTCRFTRVLGGGLESIASDLATRREIPLAEAHDLLLAVGLPEPEPHEVPASAPEPEFDPAVGFAAEEDEAAELPPAAPEPATLANAEPASPASDLTDPDADVRRVLVAGVREIAGEVRNSLDFQQSHDGGDDVASVVLSGPAVEVPGFAQALERELGIPVQSRAVGGEEATKVSAPRQRLAVATGLSFEEPRS
jgi:type IV pilus assembly protein PilM